MKAHVISAIAGGALGLAFALIGYLIAGIPGEIAGILLAVPLSLVLGMHIGRR